ncbi:MAG: hypothetical protein V2A62_03050 [Candidatus Woesearchaeota archaeon]
MLFNKLILMVLLLPTLVLAATTVFTDESSYSIEEYALITGTCSKEGAVGLQVSLSDNIVWLEQVQTIDQEFEANFIPTVEGNYTLLAACDGDKAQKVGFCYGNCAGGNGTIIPLANDTKKNQTGTYCGDGTCQSNESVTSCPADCKVTPPVVDGGTPPSGGSSGSGRSCTSSWNCGTWNYCGPSLKQTRICNDEKGCEKSRTEEKACTKCEESWVCSGWSECVSDEQVRACYDEHKCGSTVLKPSLRKFCQASYVSGPAPAYVSPQIPAPTYYPASQPEPTYTPPAESKLDALKPTKAAVPFSFSKFWNDYQIYFLGLGALIIAIIIVVVLVAHLAKPQQKVYNLEELKEWIVKERQMGTNDTQIRQILAQNTGWDAEEISAAFSELKERG